MTATNTQLKLSVLSAAVTLALGLGAGPSVAQAFTPTVTTTGNNFSMLPGIGGTNDVTFAWDGTFKFSAPLSGQTSNASLVSTSAFFGFHWTAHDMVIYGPGTYTINTACPAGSPGCIGGYVTYKPKAQYNGPDSFTYTMVDENGGAATATVHVTVTPVNTPSRPRPDLIITSQGAGPASINPLLNDVDVDDTVLTVDAVTQGANGTVTFTSNSVSYTPTGSFFGLDSFTYTVREGSGLPSTGVFSTGTVYVGVNKTGNTRPVANNDAVSHPENSSGAAVFPFSTLLGNDTDADGDPLSIIYVTSSTVYSTNGTNDIPIVNFGASTVQFPTPLNVYGSFTSTYAIHDGNGGVALGTIADTITKVVGLPFGYSDMIITQQDAGPVTINPLLNDTEPNNDPLTVNVSAVTQPAHGTVTATTNSVTYTPTPGYFGRDNFVYRPNNGVSNSSGPTTVYVAVNKTGNALPVATDDNLTIAENSKATSVYVLNNDSDSDGSLRKAKVLGVTTSAQGVQPGFASGIDISMVVKPGQVGGHMLFDYSSATDIDLLNVWDINSVFAGPMVPRPDTNGSCGSFSDCGGITTDPYSGITSTVWSGASTDIDGDGIMGLVFKDGPFANIASGNFNVMGLHAVASPTANAGADNSVTENTTVNLSGTCANVDAPVTACDWSASGLTLTSGAATGLNTNTATGNASFTAPAATTPPTQYTVTLTTTDMAGATVSDDRIITVAQFIPATPTANAGTNQTVTEGATVNLAGTCNATQSNVTSCTYTTANGAVTNLVSTPAGLGTHTATAAGTFTAPAASASPVTLTLTAVDDSNLTPDVTSNVTVTVQALAPVTVTPGSAQTVTSGDTVNLAGTCDAPQSNVTGCTYTTTDATITDLVSTPGGLSTHAATATATFTAPAVTAATTVTFTLTGVDDSAFTADATGNVTITVQPPGANTTPPDTVHEVQNKKNTLGCTLSPEPVSLSQRGEWWLLAGFMAWLGIFRKRGEVGKK